jgi:hypothetical protein
MERLYHVTALHSPLYHRVENFRQVNDHTIAAPYFFVLSEQHDPVDKERQRLGTIYSIAKRVKHDESKSYKA